jgi:mannose-1-phosphate guanylyltransferase
MKAVILAGGQGTRVRPITASVPKPMIPIINKPIIEFLVELLGRQGFDEIIMSVSYLASDIENYFRDGSRFGVRIGYSFEGAYEGGQFVSEAMGAAGGLKKIQEHSGFFDTTFAVLCGDAIIDLDFRAALAFHHERRSIATLVLKDVPRAEVSKYGVVRTDDNGRILQFQEKPSPDEAISTTVNTGIYLFEPEALDEIPAGQPFDIAREFFPRLVSRRLPFYGIAQEFTWIDVGCPADYWRATQMILGGDVNFVEMPGRELVPGVWGGINLAADFDASTVRGPVYIGSGTRIEPGVTITGPAVIGRNCHLEAGASLDRCIVGDYTRISGLAALSERIISGRFCVDRHGRNVDLNAMGCAFLVDDARERRQWNAEQQALMDFLRLPQPSGEARTP